MIVLVFLVSSIGYTVTSDIGVQRDTLGDISFDLQEAAVFNTNSSAEEKLDRASYIKRMQSKIADGEGKIPGAPVVLTSSVPASEQEKPRNERESAQRNIQWCAMLEQTADIERTWNSDDVEIYTTNDARLISHINTDANNIVSSLVLPILHSRAAEDTCIPHTIAGVSVDGSLIHISDGPRFRNYDENMLIGYALDGFPIFGARENESELDACGGTDPGTGYQYHISAEGNFIISCFASPPVDFIRT